MPALLTIHELSPNLYREGCPVIIRTGALLLDRDTGILSAAVRFLSLAEGEIASVSADIFFFSEDGDELKIIRDYLFLGGGAGRGSDFGGDMPVAMGGNAAKSFSVAIREVDFADGSFWTGSATPLTEAIPPRRTLNDALGDPDAVRRFSWAFSSSIARDPEILARFVPAKYKDLWLCACGAINQNQEEGCFCCGASYAPQLTQFSSETISAATPADRMSAPESSVFQPTADPIHTARTTRKKAEAAAPKAKSKTLAAEKPPREKKGQKRKKPPLRMALVIGVPLLLAAGIAVTAFTVQFTRQNSYSRAQALMQEGRYDDAISAFSALEGYGDSAELLLEATCQKAEALLKAENYPAALELYQSIAQKRDVADHIAQVKYRQAGALVEEGHFADALALYTEIMDYQDSKLQAQGCNFSLAKLEITANDSPSEALKQHFQKLTPADSFNLQQLFLTKGTALYTAGKEEAATAYFALITDDETHKKVRELYYRDAMKRIQKNELDAAARLLSNLSDYKDSSTQLSRIGYLQAEKAYEEGDYAGAAEIFSSLGAYNDAPDRGREASYQLGLQLLNDGNAIDSYRTLYAIKDYAPAFYLLVTDSQYYIDVYDPGVGPNPLDEQ